MQCCPRGSPDNIAHGKILFNVVVILLRQHCTGKNVVQCCPRDCRQHCTEINPMQCHLSNIWSLFGNFYFGPVNFLMITCCYKWRANIAQISSTLHKKNPGPKLNKKTKLYSTIISNKLLILYLVTKTFHITSTFSLFMITLEINYSIFIFLI